MNQWEVVWKSYMDDCTRIKIFNDAFSSITMLRKSLLSVSLVCFMLSVAAAVYSIFNEEQISKNLMFTLFGIFEVIFILMAESAIKNLNRKNYSFQEQAQVPPEDVNHQKMRYLKFRSQLKKANVGGNDIVTIIEILKAREELEEVKGTYVKRFVGFLMTLIIALTVSASKGFESDILFLIFVYGTLIGLFIYAVASMIPAKIERIRELKYFLVMYEKQHEYETVSSKQINNRDDLVAVL